MEYASRDPKACVAVAVSRSVWDVASDGASARHFPVAALVGALFLGSFLLMAPRDAEAVPSFARQTQMPCRACHASWPELTRFGREFKLRGYILEGERLDGSQEPLEAALQAVHVSGMAQGGYSRTDRGIAGGAAPGYGTNDNLFLNQASAFYAGKIFGKIGAFAQYTYDGIGQTFSWDNHDVRYADSTVLGETSVVYGLTVNNNPTVQDLWNTTPAWQYPYFGSPLAPTPAASPLLANLGTQVFGFGGYSMIGDFLYVEADGYTTLGSGIQRALGTNPSGETEIPDLAPYWRVAFQHQVGTNYFELGHFGLNAQTIPGRDASAGADSTTDLGADITFQRQDGAHYVSLLASYVYEDANLFASQMLGSASAAHNTSNFCSVWASYLYDETYGLDVEFFGIQGSTDALLYGSRNGSPNSNGWLFQIDWLPWQKNGGPSFYPFTGFKLSLQYIYYTQFDGAVKNVDGGGRNASDNNTLYLQGWWLF